MHLSDNKVPIESNLHKSTLPNKTIQDITAKKTPMRINEKESSKIQKKNRKLKHISGSLSLPGTA